MRPIVTDGVAWSVCLSVCQNREPCKTAELIEMPFGMCTQVGPRKHVLDRGAHLRQLENTTEPSVCGGDAALCQITLITCCRRMVCGSRHVVYCFHRSLFYFSAGDCRIARMLLESLTLLSAGRITIPDLYTARNLQQQLSVVIFVSVKNY